METNNFVHALIFLCRLPAFQYHYSGVSIVSPAPGLDRSNVSRHDHNCRLGRQTSNRMVALSSWPEAVQNLKLYH